MSDGLIQRLMRELSLVFEQGGVVLCLICLIGVWLYTVLGKTWNALLRVERRLAEEVQSSGGDKESIAREFTIFELESVAWVERRIPVIGVMIGVCTLGGLLGTVSGLLLTFFQLSSASSVPPTEKIAAGISQALVTTQVGLLMALPASFFYALIHRRLQMVRASMGANMQSQIVLKMSERRECEEV